MTRQEAFKILELPDNANRAQIRHAYSEKSKIYHVETHPEEFSRLHKAYKIALNKETEKEVISEDFSKTLLFHDTRTLNSVRFKQPEEETKEDSRAPYDGILDTLVNQKFFIRECQELIQLIYHKCRYQEVSQTRDDMCRISDSEMEYIDEAFILSGIQWENPPADSKLFCKTPWNKWKQLGWLSIICHPDFLCKQYDNVFLGELYQLLHEETMNSVEGIEQELYFSLCMAYGFFYQNDMNSDNYLNEIENMLRIHPKHQEYLQDLKCWAALQEEHDIVLLCQKAYAYSQKTHTLEEQQAFADTFLKDVEEKLLKNSNPEKEFIVQGLTSLSGILFFYHLPQRRRDFEQLQILCKECFQDFVEVLLDRRKDENSIFKYNYQPIRYRMKRFKERYFGRENWKKIICSPIFVQSLKEWMVPRHNGFVSITSYLEYEIWKELRAWFEGDSPFEIETLDWMKTSFYFPEYERRYQQECTWKGEHIELSAPELTWERQEILRIIEQGNRVEAEKIDDIFYPHKGPIDPLILTRITNAMVHFKFLFLNLTDKESVVSGNAFCFLKDKVILYQKEKNQTCYLSQSAFYDLLSRKIDLLAEKYESTKVYSFTNEFIGTACKNMYDYSCYLSSNSSS